MIDGVIYNCAFGDRLRAQAAEGDMEALRTLASAAPINIPKRAVMAYRDGILRRLACDLFAALPSASRHSVAGVLAQAGRDLERGRSLTSRPPFDRLLPEELGRLEAGVRYLLGVSRWPRLRQIEKIISLQFSPVETANPSGVGLVNIGDDDICSIERSPPAK